MSIYQLNIEGKDKIQTAIERYQRFEPEEGYFLAFSGGKDSVVIKALADMAGVKYDAHYAITSVDPPELVQFIKEEHPDVIRQRKYWPRDGRHHKAGDPITMWNLIASTTIPPTRVRRYCCKYLKETAGAGRFVVTGVRWAESVRRRQQRGGLELGKTVSEHAGKYDADSEELRHTTQKYAKRALNPIIDWTNDEVWEFIRDFSVPYCRLYDEGYARLGCVGCPMSTHQGEGLDRYPKIKRAYLRAFEKMLENRADQEIDWSAPEDVLRWWINL